MKVLSNNFKNYYGKRNGCSKRKEKAKGCKEEVDQVFLNLKTMKIVFEKCLAQADEPSRANFYQEIMCAFREELFSLFLFCE